MRYLLDTHLLLWSLYRDVRLPPAAKLILEDQAAARLFSAASIWEIAIKSSLGRPDFPFAALSVCEDALVSGFVELPVSSAAAARVADLPRHHGDPFDRLLVAQAMDATATLLTSDRTLARYGGPVQHVG